MDLALLMADPVSLAIVGGHLLVLVLAALATALRRWSLGGLLAGLATLASLGMGLLWVLALGGGRSNTQADASVALALDRARGLPITLYVVLTLAVAEALSWVCRRGRARRAAAGAPVSDTAPA